MIETTLEDTTINRFIDMMRTNFSDLDFQKVNSEVVVRVGVHGVLYTRVISTEIIIMARFLDEVVNIISLEIIEAAQQHEISMGRIRA